MSNNKDPQRSGAPIDARSAEGLKRAVKNGDASALLSSLNDKERETFNSLLNNKEARDKLLSSPEVKALLSRFLGG